MGLELGLGQEVRREPKIAARITRGRRLFKRILPNLNGKLLTSIFFLQIEFFESACGYYNTFYLK